MVAPNLPSQGAGHCSRVNRESMNVGFPKRRLRCCKVTRKYLRNSAPSANISTILGIYEKVFLTIMRLCRNGFGGEGHARPFLGHCRSRADGRYRRRRSAGQGSSTRGRTRAGPSQTGRSCVRRSRPRSRRGATGKPGASQASRARDQLPLRRSAAAGRRAGTALSCACVSAPSRSPASNGSPEFHHRRQSRRLTSRMGATCWRRPSARAEPCASQSPSEFPEGLRTAR